MHGMNAKKKMYGQGKQSNQHLPTGSQDTLIGMNYEATKQGDAPQGAPGKHDHHENTSSQSHIAISAPRDPQVISNSEAWGTKLGMGLAPPNQLAPPNLEEKKARKR